jgi:hypothetical protein
MPTVLRDGPYSFIFFISDRGEPPHIHVQRERYVAKFWLEPVSLAANWGFASRELRRVEAIVVENQTELLRSWNEFFAS